MKTLEDTLLALLAASLYLLVCAVVGILFVCTYYPTVFFFNVLLFAERLWQRHQARHAFFW